MAADEDLVEKRIRGVGAATLDILTAIGGLDPDVEIEVPNGVSLTFTVPLRTEESSRDVVLKKSRTGSDGGSAAASAGDEYITRVCRRMKRGDIYTELPGSPVPFVPTTVWGDTNKGNLIAKTPKHLCNVVNELLSICGTTIECMKPGPPLLHTLESIKMHMDRAHILAGDVLAARQGVRHNEDALVKAEAALGRIRDEFGIVQDAIPDATLHSRVIRGDSMHGSLLSETCSKHLVPTLDGHLRSAVDNYMHNDCVLMSLRKHGDTGGHRVFINDEFGPSILSTTRPCFAYISGNVYVCRSESKKLDFYLLTTTTTSAPMHLDLAFSMSIPNDRDITLFRLLGDGEDDTHAVVETDGRIYIIKIRNSIIVEDFSHSAKFSIDDPDCSLIPRMGTWPSRAYIKSDHNYILSIGFDTIPS